MCLREIVEKIDKDRIETCNLIKSNIVEQASSFDNIKKIAFLCYNKNLDSEISNYDLSIIFKKNKIKLCHEVYDNSDYDFYGKYLYFNVSNSKIEYENRLPVDDNSLFRSFSYRNKYFNIEELYRKLKIISERPFDDEMLSLKRFKRKDDQKTILNFGEYFLNKACASGVDITLEDLLYYTKGSKIIKDLTQDDFNEILISSKVNTAKRVLRS